MTFDDIERSLASRFPGGLPAEGLTPAAVALILREGEQCPEVLFIERAARPGDPWSGDLGFPGGKVEEGDETLRRAAERETREEIGLDLGRARFLGRLSDIAGAHLPIRVSCFIYGVTGTEPLLPGEEVRDLFWVPLADLAEPARHVTATVRFGGEEFERPAIRLPVEGKPLLWGITYRLVMQFLDIVGSSPDCG